MSGDYIRRCPTCGTENAPQVMRCACGFLLAGVDLVSKAPPEPPRVAAAGAPAPPAGVICPFDDCAQTNPVGSDTCLYCNRPLAAPTQSHSLIALPQALKDRYRIVEPLPVQGAEAELLLVQGAPGEPQRVAKVYRHGIRPRAEVQQRIARIDLRHRVEILEAGISDGYAYELMEFCAHGSLRAQMANGPLEPDFLALLVRELTPAIAEVHAAGLLHRDLKPENILLRQLEPLDLVLTDFGIASLLDATQRFTGSARTVPYAAPESLSGVLDRKADYWAMGMIVLEGALGKHPFADLSEAVILHHLSTRDIDLTGVQERALRKLLRGLLQRDPKARWGGSEIERWLAGDATLPEPAPSSAGSGFAQPYHLGDAVCHTTEQLAAALARNWRDGIADMANGQLLAWMREVRRDQNAVRLLLELRQDSRMSIDLQLLRLILYLAPGIPPVWRGETLGIRAILARAGLALKGDDDAARWLNHLHHNRVLEAYAAAGNAEADDIVRRWTKACDEFGAAWERQMKLIESGRSAHAKQDYVNFDRMVYGGGDRQAPPVAQMHARLLAAAYDKRWSERLRQRLGAELLSLAVACPWLADLGQPDAMDTAALLALEALLPEARKAAEQQTKAESQRRAADADRCAALKAELGASINALRRGGAGMLGAVASLELDAALERHFDLLARIRAAQRPDPAWQELSKTAARTQARAGQLRLLVNQLAERRSENTGWLSLQMLAFFVAAVVLAPMFFGARIDYLLTALGVGVAAWRLAPVFWIKRRIRGLARGL